jgi:anti-sigma B factor antagonist
MQITEREKGSVTILDVSGSLTIGEGDIELRDAVLEVLAGGSKNILLNLKNVRKMDSSGVGELVAAYTSTRNRGGELKLTQLSPKVGAVLQVTRLVGILEMFDDEETAIASF